MESPHLSLHLENVMVVVERSTQKWLPFTATRATICVILLVAW